jgi:cytochrome c oxidase subunit II
MNRIFGLCSIVAAGLAATLAHTATAQAQGLPDNWQLGFQDAASPVMEATTWFHNQLLMPIITIVALFVAGLMIYVMFRFNKRVNPNPSRTTHHTLLEVAWTIIPILILVVIAIPSFRLLYLQREIPDADLTIKAIGSQWYWTYEYPDNGNFVFDSLIVEDEDLEAGQPRLLTVDNEVVVPVGQVVRVIVTASDVIHDWAMPAFGIKMDAIPGRLNETWFRAERVGVYYGQCSELCGIRHAYMPITVRVVSEAEFASWIVQAKEEFASADPTARQATMIAQIQE